MGVGVNGDGDVDVDLCRCGSCTAAASTASCLLASFNLDCPLSRISTGTRRTEFQFHSIAISRCNGQRTSRHLWRLVIVCVRPAIRVREARRRSPRRLWYHLSLSACSSTHRRMTRTPPRRPKRSWRQRCLRNRDRA
jgi:hypothetical protein